MKSREVVLVDGIRTAFGRAGEQGFFWHTRADDMVVKVIRELNRRNHKVGTDMEQQKVMLSTTQQKHQGLTMSRTSALLAGLTEKSAGATVDRK